VVENVVFRVKSYLVAIFGIAGERFYGSGGRSP